MEILVERRDAQLSMQL